MLPLPPASASGLHHTAWPVQLPLGLDKVVFPERAGISLGGMGNALHGASGTTKSLQQRAPWKRCMEGEPTWLLLVMVWPGPPELLLVMSNILLPPPPLLSATHNSSQAADLHSNLSSKRCSEGMHHEGRDMRVLKALSGAARSPAWVTG